MAIRRFAGVKKDTIVGGTTVNLAAPIGVTATPSGTGGTLAAGTHYLRVTFLNAAGETVGSAEVSAVTTGSTSSISVNWTTDARATSARVYYGTASGNQTQYFTDADGVGPLVVTTATGTAGTVPNVSTARVTIPDADDIWPVTAANVDRNVGQLDRNDEITGFRGNPVPEEFRKDPRVTISAYAYQRLIEYLFFYAMGGADTVTGVAPAAITHTGVPIGYSGSGLLPALFAQIIRDDQIDKASGGWVNSVTVTFGLDGHGTVEAEIWCLYHKSSSGGSMPVLTRNVRDVKTLKLRDLRAYFNGSPVIVPGVTSFSLTYNNNIVDDTEARFAAGQSIDQTTDANGVLRRVWYPNQHFLGGSQSISGSIGFSSPQVAEDVKNDLAQAEQLVVEVEGALMATTPAAKEMMRFTVFNAVRTGGGPDGLAKEGLQKASYDFGGFIGATGTDLKVESVNNSSTPITT
jgi:hypothetical protein